MRRDMILAPGGNVGDIFDRIEFLKIPCKFHGFSHHLSSLLPRSGEIEGASVAIKLIGESDDVLDRSE